MSARSRPAPEPDRLVTTKELAERLHVSRESVDRLVSRGMPCLDVSVPRLPESVRQRGYRTRRFDVADVKRWLSQRGNQ